MSGKNWSGSDATKGIMRYGNYFDASTKVGGGKGQQGIDTGFSSSKYGKVSIDPSIRAIQEKGLGRIDEQYAQAGTYGNELIGNTRSLRSRFEGNRSAYADAQLNPLREQIASGRGERLRSNSLRGISGSSFGDQSLTNYDSETGRNLRDAQSNVEMQQLQALTGIDSQLTQQMFGQISLHAQLNGESLQVAKDRLQQELAALGVGLDEQKMMISAFEASQTRGMQNRSAIASTIVGGFGGGGGGGGGTG